MQLMTVFINYPLYLFPAMFVLLLIAVEIGRWLGSQTGVNLDEVRVDQQSMERLKSDLDANSTSR